MTDNADIREALAHLPRAEHHPPGVAIALADVYTVHSHRASLDPDRTLVIGNRGMGTRFWAHALLNPEIRTYAANQFRFPSLLTTDVAFGFNGSSRSDDIAPPPEVLAAADKGVAALTLWQAVLARVVGKVVKVTLPERFSDVVEWVGQDAERCARLFTDADDALHAQGKRLLVLFDALDRLSPDWTTTRRRLQGLMQLALATQSFRALRLKIFLRLDQFHDARLFEFSDGSKVRSANVLLFWRPSELYELLFHRLRACPAFARLEAVTSKSAHPSDELITALAGPYMGADRRRGHVATWLPIHLADAYDQISPRTFLTAWREAASYGACPSISAVDHHGILEGVRRASADRLAELSEDYPWVRTALEPLRGQSVPLQQEVLTDLWRARGTADKASRHAVDGDRAMLVPTLVPDLTPELALLEVLRFIGVVEVRSNGKVDVPDIFRVEAGIKRRGGVKPPRRASPTG